jgi:uracil-DNA glycosylase
LWRDATQTVFGEGPANAGIMLVGEQPGDREDLAGHPFVGPAGRVLDEALERAGIERSATFATNAVKHFKYRQRGKRRIHQRPAASEVAACRQWLSAEVEQVAPEVIVALGATAAHSLLGHATPVGANRGHLLETSLYPPPVLVTVHPSSILRERDRDARHAAPRSLAGELTVARTAAGVSARERWVSASRGTRSVLHPADRDRRGRDRRRRRIPDRRTAARQTALAGGRPGRAPDPARAGR